MPDRARTPLLTLITQESLDEDYQHVAEQRARRRSSRPSSRGAAASRTGRPRSVVAVFGTAGHRRRRPDLAALRRRGRQPGLAAEPDRRSADDQSPTSSAGSSGSRELNVGLQDALDAATDAERADARTGWTGSAAHDRATARSAARAS